MPEDDVLRISVGPEPAVGGWDSPEEINEGLFGCDCSSCREARETRERRRNRSVAYSYSLPDDVPEENTSENSTARFRCFSCGYSYEEPASLSNEDNTINICKECMAYYTLCEECNGPVHNYEQYPGIEETLCYSCGGRKYSRCAGCNTMSLITELQETNVGYMASYVCNACAESMARCLCCESMILPNNLHTTEDGATFCNSCAIAVGLQRDGCVSYTCKTHGSLPKDNMTFGVEVEVEFEDDSPWELSEYHSHDPASSPFLYSWRAEEDGSLAYGGEFISPILMGASGIAEVLYTYDLLKDYSATIRTSCGQHITVAVPRENTGEMVDHKYVLRVQKLAGALEEALFATTGAYSRLMAEDYAARLKRSPSSCTYLRGDEIDQGGHVTASIRDLYDGIIEFRYPPGTLTSSQFCINLGLCRWMCEVVDALSNDEVRDLVTQSLELENNHDMPRRDRLHNQVLLGLDYIVKNGGWHLDGTLDGLPYDVSNPPTISIADAGNRVYPGEVRLPGRRTIIERMHNRIYRFYHRMLPDLAYEPDNKVRRDEMLAEVKDVLRVPSEDELPLTYTGAVNLNLDSRTDD